MRLLDRLKERDAVALGVGVGHYVDEVPDTMISRAQALRIPIFESPIEVPFRTIVKYVYNALASSDMHSLKRSLCHADPAPRLPHRGPRRRGSISSLASILRIPTVLFDDRGTVLAPVDGDERTREAAVRLWAEYARVNGIVGPVGVLESANQRLYYRKVQLYGAVERVLAAAGPQASSSELIETSLSFVQRLLALDLLRSGEQLLARRRTRSLLLEDFLAERGTSRELVRRLQEQDIDLQLTWRLVFAEVEPLAAEGPRSDRRGTFGHETAVLDATDDCLAAESLSFLSLVKDRTVVVLAVVDHLPDGELRAVLAGLRRPAGGRSRFRRHRG